MLSAMGPVHSRKEVVPGGIGFIAVNARGSSWQPRSSNITIVPQTEEPKTAMPKVTQKSVELHSPGTHISVRHGAVLPSKRRGGL